MLLRLPDALFDPALHIGEVHGVDGPNIDAHQVALSVQRAPRERKWFQMTGIIVLRTCHASAVGPRLPASACGRQCDAEMINTPNYSSLLSLFSNSVVH